MFLPYVFVPAGRSCLWLPDFIGLCWTVHPVNQKIRVQDHHYVTVGLHWAGGCSFSCDDHKRAAVLHLNVASSRVLRDINRLHYRCMYFIHLCVLFNHPKCLAIFEKCFAGVSSQFVLRWLCDTSVVVFFQHLPRDFHQLKIFQKNDSMWSFQLIICLCILDLFCLSFMRIVSTV